MPIRRVSVLVAALLVVAGGTAQAATKPKPKPKPICKLVTDPSGDVSTSDQSLDITSADIVSNGRQVTTVIRVAKLSEQDLTAPGGRYFEFDWQYDGTGYSTTAITTPAGTEFYAVTSPAKGVFDWAHNEIRVTADVDSFPGHPTYRTGALITNFRLHSDQGAPKMPIPVTFGFLGDTGQGAKTYPVGAASCVKLGA